MLSRLIYFILIPFFHIPITITVSISISATPNIENANSIFILFILLFYSENLFTKMTIKLLRKRPQNILLYYFLQTILSFLGTTILSAIKDPSTGYEKYVIYLVWIHVFVKGAVPFFIRRRQSDEPFIAIYKYGQVFSWKIPDKSSTFTSLSLLCLTILIVILYIITIYPIAFYTADQSNLNYSADAKFAFVIAPPIFCFFYYTFSSFFMIDKGKKKYNYHPKAYR